MRSGGTALIGHAATPKLQSRATEVKATVNPRFGPVFPVSEIPFSYRGSWLNISPVIAEGTYADDLHLVSHQTGLHPVLRFVAAPSDAGDDVQVHAAAAQLSWLTSNGRADAAFEAPDTIRIRGDGLGLRLLAPVASLTPFSGHFWFRDPRDGAFVFTVYETGRRYRISVLSGQPTAVFGLEVLGVAERGLELPASQPWEIAIEEYETGRAPYTSNHRFDQVVAATDAQFRDFCDAVASWRDDSTPAAELASYVMWSATVHPHGFVVRPAVLMSKHWMDKVWSWDHCFNAIALADGDPGFALDQYLLPFDLQDDAGALPDSVTHSEVLYNFVKPPIHGWALERLRALAPATDVAAALTEIYQRLERWTQFWLDARRAPGHELPYYQHGNDSGWDNATIFDRHRVLESADLAAFLVLQMRALSRLAAELGDVERADRWSASATQMQSAMLSELWTGDAFAARSPATGEKWHSATLLSLMPIVLGDALPEHVRDGLIAGIRDHLTGWGLATEQPSSDRYEPDGYWRGPIWAPATILIEDGVRRAGDAELANEISDRFRRMCEKSGFAENFDALSGQGLRDRAYTWTAAAYLMLARSAVLARCSTSRDTAAPPAPTDPALSPPSTDPNAASTH